MASPELQAAVDAAFAIAQAAWPAIAVPAARFHAHVADRVSTEASPLDAIAHLHAADLYLSVACADGDATALAALDRDYLPAVRSPLVRMGLSPAQLDEALQVVRHDLLVPRPNAPARIASYSGRGQLRAWLRAVAARTALRIKDPDRHDELDERLHAQTSGDLELAYMKKTYGDAFQRAFRVALAGLAPDNRVLLKQRFRHRLELDELGALHGVHGATVSRWIAAAREALVKATRDAMMAELGVGKGDVSSILRMIYSEIEISLGTIDERAR